MGKNIRDCVPLAFGIMFEGNVPREISPREVKDLRTVLCNVARREIGYRPQKKDLGGAIKRYIDSRGYEKKFIKDRERLNRPQWVYTLPV